VKLVETYAGSRLVRVAFWAAALFALIMALIPHPPEVHVRDFDKVEHAVAFGTLGALAAIGYRRLSALRLILVLSAYGATIELLQGTALIHRDADPFDWVADTIACALVIIVLRGWLERRR
jgi:VanZ family protein